MSWFFPRKDNKKTAKFEAQDTTTGTPKVDLIKANFVHNKGLWHLMLL